MNTFRNFLEGHLKAVIVFSIAIIIIILSLMSYQIISLRRSNLFSLYRERVDQLIPQNRSHESVMYIREMMRMSQSADDFLTIISRISDFTDEDTSLYEEVLDSGLERYSGNQELIAIKVNALLNKQEIYEAAELAQNLRMHNSLKTEAYLRSGRPLDSNLQSLVSTQLPLSPEEISNPRTMIEAFLLSNDIRYLVNGIVMNAALGNIEEAYNIFTSRLNVFLSNPEFLNILLHLMVDTTRYDDLESIHEHVRNYGLVDNSSNGTIDFESAMLLADLYFSRGNGMESYYLLQEINEHDTTGRSLNNQFSMLRAHGLDLILPLEVPHHSIEIIRHILGQENANDAFYETLNYYSSLYPRIDLQWIEELRAFRSSEPDYRIQDSIVDLWASINEGSNNIYTRNLLLYLLYLSHDIEGMTEIIDRYKRDLAISVFIGYIYTVNSNKSESRSVFEGAAQLGSFQASFNRGLFSLEDGNVADASRWFKQSLMQLDRQTGFTALQEGRIYYEDRLRIQLYEAIAAALLRDYNKAQEIFDYLEANEFHHYMLPFLKGLIIQQ